MMQSHIEHPRTIGANPFATRAVRPGQLPFQFPPGTTASQLADQLAARCWSGAVIGPHGSGKSTLLQALLPELERRGRQIRLVTLRRGQIRLPSGSVDWRRCSTSTQVVVDGYEQLVMPARLALRYRCRSRSAGLLVTAHRPVGLRVVWKTGVSLELAHQLVRKLLADDLPLISTVDLETALAARQGNLREVFFDLYDLYESRRPHQRMGSKP